MSQVLLMVALLIQIYGGSFGCLPPEATTYPTCYVYTTQSVFDVVNIRGTVRVARIDTATYIIGE